MPVLALYIALHRRSLCKASCAFCLLSSKNCSWQFWGVGAAFGADVSTESAREIEAKLIATTRKDEAFSAPRQRATLDMALFSPADAPGQCILIRYVFALRD